ncbi:hypothetical protein DYI25_16515 [Mesobacillus boroniphilus]|uniref:Uncharacterized protein n=1 Tax=Mesobacillus boroniphilus TaxID=308892 RepID=A0A944GXR1_9BACI|nr:hypothetical protein [Mesobacillus boroniphilus]MBS8266032.1 hypothetical protein [Mesobacillus boroniphilus]
MDDQLLEKRLESLKKAYDDMPEDENRSAILAAIKKDQKKKNQNKWFHLPYAASFIGVGMIAGVLMMQYIGGNGPSTDQPSQHQPSGEQVKTGEMDPKEVEEQFKRVEKHFYKKRAEAEKKIGVKGIADERTLARGMLEEIESAKKNILANLKEYNQDELNQLRNDLIKMIDAVFTLPSESIKNLKNEDRSRYADMELEMQLLTQLDYYQSLYWHPVVLQVFDKELKKNSAAEIAAKLNAGGSGIENERLKALAAGAKANGYYFQANENGTIKAAINYPWVADQVKNSVHPDFLTYMQMLDVKIHDDGGNVRSYKELGELLVNYEKTYHSLKHEMIKEYIKGAARSYYAEFVLGRIPSRIFDENNVLKNEVREAYKVIIKLYPDSDTGKAIKAFYGRLEENNFLKPSGFDEETVRYPLYLVAPNNLKNEDVFFDIFPLPNALLSSYKEFAAKKNWNILKNYSPFEIMQLYLHADKERDHETMYALYSHNEALPSLERYVKEQEDRGGLGNLLRGYQFSTLYYAEDDPDKIVGIQLHYTEGADSLVFQMTQEDGFWKVQYLPFQ